MTERLVDGITVQNRNITFVFDRLPLEAVSRDALHRLPVEGEPPTLIDIPGDTLAVTFGQSGLQVAFSPRRMVAAQTDGTFGEEQSNVLSALAEQALKAVPDSAKVVGVGFNYQIQASVDAAPVGELLRDRYINHRRELEKTAGGRLTSVAVQLTFDLRECRLNMSVGPGSAVRIATSRINVHYPRWPLPGGRQLSHEFQRRLQETGQTVRRILAEDWRSEP
jgi:hypothetical protein